MQALNSLRSGYGTAATSWLHTVSAQPIQQGHELPSSSKCESWHQRQPQTQQV